MIDSGFMRKSTLLLLCALSLAFSSSLALAEAEGEDWVIESEQERMSILPYTLRIEIGPEDGEILPYPDDPSSHPGSHILFVNPCWGGITISPGANDSRTNRSSIIGSTRTLAEWSHGDAAWDQFVLEMKEIMSPFGIQVTDEDPSPTPHHEALVCGRSWWSGVLGVAPGSCGVIENSITFTFANDHPSNPRYIAHTAGQEAAHAWGLDHEYDCADIMTYLQGCGDKHYVDAYLNCAGVDGGSWVAQNCMCGGTTQNSYRHIFGIFGGPLNPTPPDVTITEPSNNQTVEPGFVVRADITDDEGILQASLFVDGSPVLLIEQPPFVFNGPSELADGSHQIEVRAVDRLGSEGSDTIYVIVGEPCGGPGDCEDGETCVDGRCVLGDCPGGLGCNCEIGDNCSSRLCGNDGDDQFCTEVCDPDANGCPSGFACRADGAGGGVCWPGSGGGGGCRTAIGDGKDRPVLALGFLCLIALIALRRRRDGDRIDNGKSPRRNSRVSG